jgi:O-antigen/teichoic acid export membrane protein
MTTNTSPVSEASNEGCEVRVSESVMQRFASRLGLPLHSLWYFVSIGITFLLVFGQSAYAAKSLGPVLFGIWNILAITYSYGLLAHGGVLNALAREYPRAVADRDWQEAQRIMQSAFWANALGTVLFAAIASVTLLIAFSKTPEVTGHILLLFVVFLLLQGWTNFLLFAFRARDEFRTLSAFTVALNAGVLLCAFILIPRWHLQGFVLGWTATYLLVTVLFVSKTPRHLLTLPPLAEVTRLLNVGWPILLFALAATINWTMDRLLIARFLGLTAVGQFAVAAFAVRLLTYVPDMVSQVMYPHWAAARLSRNATRRELSAEPFRMMFWIMPLLSGLAYYTCFLIPVFLPNYRGIVLPAQILCLAASLMSIGLFCGGFLGASGQEKLALQAQVAAIGLRLVVVGAVAALGGTLLRVTIASGFSAAIFGVAVLWVTASGLRGRWTFMFHGLMPWFLCIGWLFLIEFARGATAVRTSIVPLAPWVGAALFLLGAVLIFMLFVRRAAHVELAVSTLAPSDLVQDVSVINEY